jgi:nitrate reductase assembly molybdenum cofactor insertion protein NarJ
MSFKNTLKEKKERYEEIVNELMALKNKILEEGKNIENDLDLMRN